MLGIKPYINFKGNCQEAINFYQEKLGAEVLFIGRYGDSPMKGKAPDEMIMHCTFKIGDSHVMACDSVFEEYPVIVGNNITLAIGTNDVEQADKMFEQLSDGAQITMPMQETFWAKKFGMLTDKFGINWMFNCESEGTDHAKATA
jgi:PhnB protein